MTGIWNKRSLEFQARAATRGNTLSLQLFQNIRQSEVCSFELSIWVLRVSPFFVFPISVSYFSFSVYSSGSCRRAAAFTALPLRQALPALSHQGFASLLCNCGFVDWGLTFSSKGRLLRSGILCRATVYESAMSPTSCYQVTGMAIARDDLDRHTWVYRVTVQILEKEQRWTPRQVLQRVKWTRFTTAISPNQHFCKCGRENLQRSLRSKLFL